MRMVVSVAWAMVVLHVGYYMGAVNGFYGWYPS